jgi:serine/threonine-protein kinase
MSATASPAPVKEGDILASKYRVEKVLGIGGMGVVVAAHHLDLDQRVALKFLLPQASANYELVGRFLREAKASVRLKGTHVAKTLDVGRLEDGAPYIVMEFLDGHDLHAELLQAEGHLATADVASYMVQAAEGLAEAHSLGIVHRDLKPGNLFLTRGVDGKPLVKVLDFGISKTLDPSPGGAEALSLTKTEVLLGSPLYMSPEQMRSSKSVDERSDIWALGAIAYELLTGKVPFEASSLFELCLKVAQEAPPNPKVHRPELPDELCAAVLKCLEKEPAARFANVGEVAHAFEPFALARNRGAAERALDVLGTGRRPPMRSVPDGLESGSTSVAPPVATRLGEASSGGGAPSPAAEAFAATAAVPGASITGAGLSDPVAPAAWGTTQGQPSAPVARPKRGLPFAIAALAAVVVVGGLAAFAASRGSATSNSATSAAPGTNGATSSAAVSGGPSTAAAATTAGGTSLAAAASAAASSAAASSAAASSATATSAAAAGKPEPAAGTSPEPPAKGGPTVDAGARLSSPVAKGAASGKAGKPAVSAAAPATAATPAPADPGGFLKVRE